MHVILQNLTTEIPSLLMPYSIHFWYLYLYKKKALIIFPFISYYSAVSLCLKGIAVPSEMLNITWRKTMIKFSPDTPMTANA